MKNKIKIHFVGISGIGMSGIAELMQDKGYLIQGSDITLNDNTKRLKKKGIKFFLGHDKNNINSVDAVVFSSAINKKNPEIKAALINKIPLLSRADMLGELMKNKKCIAVAGAQLPAREAVLRGGARGEDSGCGLLPRNHAPWRQGRAGCPVLIGAAAGQSR